MRWAMKALRDLRQDFGRISVARQAMCVRQPENRFTRFSGCLYVRKKDALYRVLVLYLSDHYRAWRTVMVAVPSACAWVKKPTIAGVDSAVTFGNVATFTAVTVIS